jgi:HAD superfamily hydrolase (TIGR01509 family)
MTMNNTYPIKAVAFDMDGVLIDSNQAIEDFWRQWAHHEQIDYTQQTIDVFIHGRTTQQTIQELFASSTPLIKERIQAEAMDFDLTMQPALIDHIDSFLPRLSTHISSIALVTSAPKQRTLKMLRPHGIDSYFQQLVTGEEVGQGKPHPEPYLTAANKLGIAPEECLVFEDSDSGIASALAAGMFVIAVNNVRMISERIIARIRDYSTLHVENQRLTLAGASLSVKLVNER